LSESSFVQVLLDTYKMPVGLFRVNSQEAVRPPSQIFLKFYSNCHYPYDEHLQNLNEICQEMA